MRFLSPSSIPNFRLNSGQLERPIVIPSDIPVQKRDKLIDLILYGLRKDEPILIELNWDSISKCLVEQHRPSNINGLNLNKNAVVITHIDKEQQLDNYYKQYKRLPVLLTIAISTNPDIKVYRKWISQLKTMVVESVQKTIFEDKLIEPESFQDFPFTFALQNFEDPIDCIDFLNKAIEKRMECDDIDYVMRTAFCEIMAYQFATLNPDELSLLFTLAVTKIHDEISNLTSFDKEKVTRVAQSLSSKGFLHIYGNSLNPTAPIQKLSDADFFELIGVLLRESMGEDFKPVEELYSNILISLRPHVTNIKDISTMQSTELGAISTSDILHSDIAHIKDSVKEILTEAGLNDIVPALDNGQNIIGVISNVLWKENDEQKRKPLLAARSLAYIIENNPEKSLKDAINLKADAEYNDIVRRLYLENSRLLTIQGKWDRALDALREGILTSEKIDRVRGEFLDATGRILANRGEYAKAMECHNQALEIGFDIDDKYVIWKTYYSIGYIHKRKGELQLALDKYNQALDILTKIKDKKGIATTLNNIGSIHGLKEELQLAFDKYNQALDILTKIKDKQGIATTLNNIGYTHQLKGEYQLALDTYNQALEILTEIGDKKGIASTLNNIGAIHELKKEYQLALDKYNRALKILTEIEDKKIIATTLSNIGTIYGFKEEYQLALDKYNRALEILTEIEDKQGIAITLNYIGLIHRFKGEYQLALDKYNRALEILTEIENKQGIAITLNYIGLIHELKREYQLALDTYNQVLEIQTEIGDKQGIAKIIENVDMIHASMKKNITRQQHG